MFHLYMICYVKIIKVLLRLGAAVHRLYRIHHHISHPHGTQYSEGATLIVTTRAVLPRLNAPPSRGEAFCLRE